MQLRHMPFVLGLIASATLAEETVEHRPMPSYVTSQIVLPVSCQVFSERVLDGLQPSKERLDAFYASSGFVSATEGASSQLSPAYAEQEATALYGKEFFKNPANKDKIFVHFMGQAIRSSYYMARGAPLAYGVTFAIETNSTGLKGCRVEVQTVSSKVFAGKELNLHAMGMIPSAKDVPRSPVDEYRLLVYVAHLVGVKIKLVE